MIFGLLAPTLIAIICALLLLSLLAPAQAKDSFPIMLRVFISMGMGLGISSCLLFLCLVFSPLSKNTLVISELSLIATLIICLYLKLRACPGKMIDLRAARLPTKRRADLFISVSFFITLTLSLMAFILLVGTNPHGEWDAIAIWNLKARFIFRSGINWEMVFSNHIAHPDYPLLIPLSIVRLWTYVGKETAIVPPLISGLFVFGTVGLLVTGITIAKGRRQEYLGGMVLLAIPFFFKLGTFLYADVPYAFYLLATIILLHIYGRPAGKESSFLIMAGITASLAAWTKNEELLFMVAIIVVFLITRVLWRKPVAKEITLFMLGSLPVTSVIIYFKMAFAVENDLISGVNPGHILARLTDLSRYMTILDFFVKRIIDFGDWNILPLVLFVYLIFMVFFMPRDNYTEAVFPALTVIVMAAGYFFVYVAFSPYDLLWHLNTSLERLIIQLTPIILFTYFLIIPNTSKFLAAKK